VDENIDNKEDTLSKDPNQQGRGILSKPAEVVLYDDDNLPDIIDQLTIAH